MQHADRMRFDAVWREDGRAACEILRRGEEVGLPRSRRGRLATRLMSAAVAGATLDAVSHVLAPLTRESVEAGAALGALLDVDADRLV